MVSKLLAFRSLFHLEFILPYNVRYRSNLTFFFNGYPVVPAPFTKVNLYPRDLRCCLSVQFSRSVVSDSLRPHEPQHARPPCPSPTPRVHPNPCPSSRWCHPALSSSVIPFSSCSQCCLYHTLNFHSSWVSSWTSQSVSLVYLLIHVPVPKCFICRGFIV